MSTRAIADQGHIDAKSEYAVRRYARGHRDDVGVTIAGDTIRVFNWDTHRCLASGHTWLSVAQVLRLPESAALTAEQQVIDDAMAGDDENIDSIDTAMRWDGQ